MHSHDTPRRGVGIQTEESINQSGYYPWTRGRGNRFYLKLASVLGCGLVTNMGVKPTLYQLKHTVVVSVH